MGLGALAITGFLIYENYHAATKVIAHDPCEHFERDCQNNDYNGMLEIDNSMPSCLN